MSIYNLTFLFLFLPLFGLIYYLVPARYRLSVLFVSTLCFVLSFGFEEFFLMLFCVYTDFLLSKKVSQGNQKVLYLCVLKDLAVFVVASALDELSIYPFPIGVTVYSFTSMGYLIDLYHGETTRIESPAKYLVFCSFFAKLDVGPIVSSNLLIPQLRDLKPDLYQLGAGAKDYIHGLAKYVLLALHFETLSESLRAIPADSRSVVSVWLLVLSSLFSIYYLLSGFSDMAKGIGKIFAIDLPENFQHPLHSDSVTDFFSRFNVSANRFVRKYVYAALGETKNGRLSTVVNIMLITMLMGIWYGVRLNYLFWGATLGLFIVFETLTGDKVLPKFPDWLRQIYAVSAVLLSFTWYCGQSLKESVSYMASMVGLAGLPVLTDATRYLVKTNYLLLACGFLFCTRIGSYVSNTTAKKHPALYTALSIPVDIGLLMLSLSFLV